MTDNPLFVRVLVFLCNVKLLFSETLCFQGFQTPKDTARRVPTGMPQKRTESVFKRTQKFKKSANLLS